ncbi:MAG: type II restriction enzyme [Fervidobacterium sp.]
MGTKQQVISRLFEICMEKGDMTFDNHLVKKISQEVGFGNPFDVTKIDHSTLLPPELHEKDYFIVHLGEGIHAFYPGIKYGYHKFEPILDQEKIPWKYRQSLLNEFDSSESNILSVVSNQRILHDFLYNDIVASPKVYNARRTKKSFKYMIGNKEVTTTNLQMEIDLTLEYQSIVTIIEGKNGFPEDFAVYQLFHPFKYYSELKNHHQIEIEQITCCYVLRKKFQNETIIRLYNYTFYDEKHIDSLTLLNKAEYVLMKR